MPGLRSVAQVREFAQGHRVEWWEWQSSFYSLVSETQGAAKDLNRPSVAPYALILAKGRFGCKLRERILLLIQ